MGERRRTKGKQPSEDNPNFTISFGRKEVELRDRLNAEATERGVSFSRLVKDRLSRGLGTDFFPDAGVAPRLEEFLDPAQYQIVLVGDHLPRRLQDSEFREFIAGKMATGVNLEVITLSPGLDADVDGTYAAFDELCELSTKSQTSRERGFGYTTIMGIDEQPRYDMALVDIYSLSRRMRVEFATAGLLRGHHPVLHINDRDYSDSFLGEFNRMLNRRVYTKNNLPK